MHGYLVTRGILSMRDEWVAQMRSKFFDFPRKNLKTGEIENFRVQLAMRPIELWECVFPKEGLQEFQMMIHSHGENKGAWGNGKTKVPLVALRKMLGAKYCPPLKEPINIPIDKMVIAPGFGGNLIGIKEDRVEEFPQWGYEQEAL